MENQEEIWKTIEGFEDYQVSNFGRVKSLSRKVRTLNGFRLIKERILKNLSDSSGYYTVYLCKNGKNKMYRVHQLVAIAFLNHKPCGYKLVINHKDFNKRNNNVENIEIVSQRENANKKHIESSSKYTGVTWYKKYNKWRANIYINGKPKYLGYFTDEIEASNAYQNKLKEICNKERK